MGCATQVNVEKHAANHYQPLYRDQEAALKWKTEGILRDADLLTLINSKRLVKGLLDGKTETDAFSDYAHIPRACVSGENIKLLFAQTVAQCKIACDAMAACLAVEFGVPYKCLWIGCFFCGSYFQKDAAHYPSTQSLHSHGTVTAHSLEVRRRGWPLQTRRLPTAKLCRQDRLRWFFL